MYHTRLDTLSTVTAEPSSVKGAIATIPTTQRAKQTIRYRGAFEEQYTHEPAHGTLTVLLRRSKTAAKPWASAALPATPPRSAMACAAEEAALARACFAAPSSAASPSFVTKDEKACSTDRETEIEHVEWCFQDE
jgi:hypothetical protein